MQFANDAENGTIHVHTTTDDWTTPAYPGSTTERRKAARQHSAPSADTPATGLFSTLIARLVLAITGIVLVLVGIPMLILPGPGLLAIAGGLACLAGALNPHAASPDMGKTA